MRRHQLEYLRELAASILVEGQAIYTPAPLDPVDGLQPLDPSRFLDQPPPADRFAERVPCIVARIGGESGLVRDGRLFRRLGHFVAGTGPFAGRIVERFIRRRYGFVTLWMLDFWFDAESFAREIVRDRDAVEHSVIEQALRYVADNRHVEDAEGRQMRIEAKSTQPVTDPLEQLPLYKVVLMVEFHDGIYDFDEQLSVGGGSLSTTTTTG